MAAALVLDLRGATINVMVLAGFVIALGVVVDDAIIDVENIVRRLRQHARQGSTTVDDVPHHPRRLARGAQRDRLRDADRRRRDRCRSSSSAGLSGAFFRPLAVSYALAVAGLDGWSRSTVTPALCLILLRSAPARAPRVPLLRGLKRGYATVLDAIVRAAAAADRRRSSLIVLAGRGRRPTLGQTLLPNFKERDFLMHWVTKPGTSQPEETRITVAGCKELRAIPGVRNCGSHIGQALLADEVYGVYFGENWISVDPRRRLRPDPGRGPGGRRRLPRHLPRRPDLPARSASGRS